MVNLCVTEQGYGYARTGSDSPVMVLINNAANAADFSCDVSRLGLAEGTGLKDRLGQASELSVSSGQVRVHLPPRTAGVYSVR